MPAFPVDIDPEAGRRLARMLERKGTPESFVRIGVKGGGCSGLEYVVRVDTRRTEFDLETEVEGITVVCDAKSAVFLQGARLVYTGNLIGGGFQFENPNAQRDCGCGSSFTPKPRD